MSVSDILDHLCAPETLFSEIALCSVAFLSPRAPLLRIHWPLATVPEPLCSLYSPLATRHYLLRPFPAGYCHPPTTELPKTERDPISTSGPSIFSMSPKFSILPYQAISSDRSIRFSPLATARPLTAPSWPEAIDALGSRRAGRLAIGRSACCLAVSRATEAGLGSKGRLDH